MIYRRRSSQQPVEREDLDRWLVSYADYMTLLFALFVVLYALSLLKNEEFKTLTESLSVTFDNTQKQASTQHDSQVLPKQNKQSDFELYGSSLDDPKGPELLADSSNLSEINAERYGNPLQGLEQELTRALTELIAQGVARLRQDNDWLVVELNSGLLFASGSASATASARTVLQEIGTIINPVNNYIRVRGYTDDIPIRNEVFSSNWELSVARATTVLRLLESLGTPSHRMAIEGFGQFSPSADNNTAVGRAENRKVEIAISRYGYQAAPLTTEAADPEQEEQLQQLTQEDGSIQVISLPGGGIRITTRKDNPDALPEQQDP